MDFDDRLAWLLFGCAIGFILGYIVRSLREIKKDSHETNEVVHHVDELMTRRKNDDGFVRYPVLKDVMLFTVVLLVAWSAFASQSASNQVTDNQEQIASATAWNVKLAKCNQTFLEKALVALNERTVYVEEQAKSNVRLQKAQADFWMLLLVVPPEPESVQRDAASTYLEALRHFVTISTKAAEKVRTNPYPTIKEFKACADKPH